MLLMLRAHLDGIAASLLSVLLILGGAGVVWDFIDAFNVGEAS